MSKPQYPIWDLPTRLFHWLLALCFVFAWITYKAGWMEWHSYIGYTVLTLVGFRICWGILGSTHSRFSDFVRGPIAVWRYLRGKPVATPGHNPLGGWSVVLMLLVVLLQAATGLFNADDIMFSGPLHRLVDEDLAGQLGAIHESLYYLLTGLVILHIGAIIHAQRVKRQNLLPAMLFGRGAKTGGQQASASNWLALASLLASAALVWWILSFEPPPPVYF